MIFTFTPSVFPPSLPAKALGGLFVFMRVCVCVVYKQHAALLGDPGLASNTLLGRGKRIPCYNR